MRKMLLRLYAVLMVMYMVYKWSGLLLSGRQVELAYNYIIEPICLVIFFFAVIYCILGGEKKHGNIIKAMLIVHLVECMVDNIALCLGLQDCNLSPAMAFWSMYDLIYFAIIFVLLIVPELGKKKSLVLCGIQLLFAILDAFIVFIYGPVEGSYLMAMLDEFIWYDLLDIMPVVVIMAAIIEKYDGREEIAC